MNIECKAINCVLVGKSKNTSNKDGESKTYYSISVCQNEGEAGSLNVPKEVFDTAVEHPDWMYKPVVLGLRYRESAKFGNYIGVVSMELDDGKNRR